MTGAAVHAASSSDMRTIEIDGKRYDWRHIRELRRQQVAAEQRSTQLTLFDLREDSRPVSQKTADGRYTEPLLFEE